MIKFISAGIVLMAATSAASPSDYTSITFVKTDGTQTAVSVSNLVMTVENGAITAVSNDSSVDIPLDQLLSFHFSNDPAGVDDVEIDYSQPVEVFDTTGKSLGSYDDVRTAVGLLQPGIYVMKTPAKTFKTVVK